MAEGQGNNIGAGLFQLHDAFIHNAAVIFRKAVKLVAEADVDGGQVHTDLFNLLDQMLHSILFLGNIHSPKCTPRQIFGEEDLYDIIKSVFRNAFERYRTDVPLRTPFSYFLELVVKVCGENNEDAVMARLQETRNECRNMPDGRYPLISSVICICQVSNRRYYGVSLTCPGYIERQIMTAVSCLHVWHPYVSSAVMDVFPEDTTEPRFPDGKIRLPGLVQCRAFALTNLGVVKPPCMRCFELYSLPNPAYNRNPPGDCAETEAISNLLANEERVKNETRIPLKSHFDEKMNKRLQGNHSYSINRTNRQGQSFATRFYNLRITQPVSIVVTE